MRLIIFVVLVSASVATAQRGFIFRDNPSARKIELLYDGRLLTAYTWFDSAEKPVLYPLRTLSGVTITRGFPVAPRPGERTDHPHHIGLWFTYEHVNGLDFWNNSYAIPPARKPHYGSIRHQEIVSKAVKGRKAKLVTRSHWVDQSGAVLMEEVTTFNFSHKGKTFVIDRTASLKALVDVHFDDVKDGMLGLRVARSLEMPSWQKDHFIEADGKESETARVDNGGVTGMYRNKEGVQGDAVWSSKSTWAVLKGNVGGKTVSIAIIDHRNNPGYPAYWHARGYGLFAVNPLGRKVFSNGKDVLNFSLKQGSSAGFTYRVLIHEGNELTDDAINEFEEDFNRR